MKPLNLTAAAFLALLTACSSPAGVFYTAPAPEVRDRVPSRYSSVELLQVSLPSYAAGEDVFVSEADGVLQTDGLLWADDPTRTMTLSLTRALTEITGAQVASAPWPFETFPEARVDVRVERFLAEASGVLVLRGQYFVAGIDEDGGNTARLFDLSRTLPPEPTLQDLLATRSALVADLAVMIAGDGLK